MALLSSLLFVFFVFLFCVMSCHNSSRVFAITINLIEYVPLHVAPYGLTKLIVRVI